MINRVLIRIKVVQLLYSYLLVENSFSLESQPAQPTREKRFAYSLYLDTLYLMLKVAEQIKRRAGDRPLYDTRFMGYVAADEHIHALSAKYANGGFPFAGLVDTIAEAVKESGLYKKFLKSEEPGSRADEMIWKDIFNLIIYPNERYARISRDMENYSLSGVDKMRSMMDDTFSNFFASSDNLPDALNTLRMSLGKARELYFRLLWLPVRLVNLRTRDIEDAQKKFIQTAEDRNPNLRFVENEFVAQIRDNEEIEKAVDSYGRELSNDDEPMLRALLKAIMESDIYKEYMEFPVSDFKGDCDFWRKIYRDVIFDNPALLEALEDKSVFWNDDISIIGDFVIKTVKRISDGDSSSIIMPMYKDEEDARFGNELFTFAVKGKDKYRQMINKALDTNRWEADRLAYMDVVIMIAALAEIFNFPAIPRKVSINEYVEMAKAYSSPKSGMFVNGMISSILKNEDNLM